MSTAAAAGTAASSARHQRNVHHRGLVDDQQAAVDGIVRVAPEATGPRIDLEQPVDGPGLPPGGLAHPPGGPAGRRAQRELDALGGQDAQDGVDDGRLAHARPAGDDDRLGRERQPHGRGLARRQRQAGLPLHPGQRLVRRRWPATGACRPRRAGAARRWPARRGTGPRGTRTGCPRPCPRRPCPRPTPGPARCRIASSGTSSRRAASGPSSARGQPAVALVHRLGQRVADAGAHPDQAPSSRCPASSRWRRPS